MRARLSLLLVLGLTLAACGTPQEQCVNRATHDLRVVNGLISGLQTDIARGYRYEEHEITTTQWMPCGRRPGPPPGPRPPGAHPPPPGPQMCLRDVSHTIRRPVAINIASERNKLTQLVRKRDQLERRARLDIAACKQAYPE